MATIRRFRIVNMLGGMNTVSEENNLLGLDPNANLGVGFSVIKTEFRTVRNFLPLNRGGLSKTFGFTLHKNVGSSVPITGLYRYIKSDGTSLFMVSYGTKVYKLVAGTLTDIGATISNNAYTHFETAYDKLIVCDGVVAPQQYDGTTTANLGGSPPAGARQSLFFRDRLFIFGGTANPSLLYYSTAGNIEAGYSTNFINCDVNDGQKITAISRFFIPGELEPTIIVAKERSVGIVTGDGTAGNPFTFQKITTDVGVPGFRQIVQFEEDMAFLTPRGISSYETAVKNINVEQQFLTKAIYDQFTGLISTTLPNALAWNDWKRRRISFAVATGNSTYPNRIWHYDIDARSWVYQDGFNVTASLVDTDGTLYTGDDTGKIYKHDTTVYTYNGGAINGSLATPYLDFFEPFLYKRLRWASITARGNGSYSVGVSTKRDFGVSIGSTHTISLTNTAYTWNGGTWTDNSAVYRWGAAPIVTQVFYPKGIFKNIQFTFNQTGASQPVDLFELNFEVEYLAQY